MNAHFGGLGGGGGGDGGDGGGLQPRGVNGSQRPICHENIRACQTPNCARQGERMRPAPRGRRRRLREDVDAHVIECDLRLPGGT